MTCCRLTGRSLRYPISRWNKHGCVCLVLPSDASVPIDLTIAVDVDSLLRKGSCRLYILRVCEYSGYPKEQLTKLFDLLIMSLFLYGIEIWGAASISR